MNELKKEILNLTRMSIGMSKHLNGYSGASTAYLIREQLNYGVAVENINDVKINERFSNVLIKSTTMTIEKRSIPIIYLSIDERFNIEDYTFLAESFLSEYNSDLILNKPLEWVNIWKSMLGDTIEKPKVYDLIGELLVLKTVLKSQNKAVWQASKMGVHDIESEELSIEVKSTVKRVETTITVSSSFQLKSTKILNLYFCRFEENEYGKFSIDILVNDIVELGYSGKILEEELERLQYPKDSSSRSKKYELLEVRKYKVDKENFPIISLEEINKYAVHSNIIGYKLELDLSSLDYEKVEI